LLRYYVEQQYTEEIAMNRYVVGGEVAIRALSPQIAELLKRTGQAEDVTLAPEYFLERNELRGVPWVVLIHEGGQIAAVLYGRERRVLGMRTGMVQFGDYYGDCAVIARQDFKATAVAEAALKVLELPQIHSVRASYKVSDQNDSAAIHCVLERTEIQARMLPEMVQHILPLKNTFDAFLNTLGSHTRRNLRVYRRRVEQKGWKFVPRLGPAEMTTALQALEKQQGKHTSSAHYLNCCQAALKAVPGSFHAGICTGTGEWVSLASGWLRNDRYFMLLQLNDGRYVRDSISTVMRSYLIENLIASGTKSIDFVCGCSELLRQFCTPQLCAHYLFEKRSALNMARQFIAPRFFKTSMLNRITQAGQETRNQLQTSETLTR
jgi:hypothetical protein